MQAITVTVLALVAVASAGGLVGYSTGNYVQHAHAVSAVAAPVAVAQPVVRSVGIAHAPIGIAHAGGLGYGNLGYASGLAGPVGYAGGIGNLGYGGAYHGGLAGVGYNGLGYAGGLGYGAGYAGGLVG